MNVPTKLYITLPDLVNLYLLRHNLHSYYSFLIKVIYILLAVFINIINLVEDNYICFCLVNFLQLHDINSYIYNSMLIFLIGRINSGRF